MRNHLCSKGSFQFLCFHGQTLLINEGGKWEVTKMPDVNEMH